MACRLPFWALAAAAVAAPAYLRISSISRNEISLGLMMATIRRSSIIAWFTTFSLLVSMFAGLMICGGGVARAQDTTTLAKARKVARDLANAPFTTKVEMKVLVQLNVPESPAFTAFLNRNDVKVQYRYTNFPIYALKLNSVSLASALLMNEVDYVSLRKPLKKFGHISLTTGA